MPKKDSNNINQNKPTTATSVTAQHAVYIIFMIYFDWHDHLLKKKAELYFEIHFDVLYSSLRL